MAEDEYMFCVNTLNDMRKLPNEMKGRNRVQRISLFFHFTMLRFNFSPLFLDENDNNNNNNDEGGEGSSSSSLPSPPTANNNNNKSSNKSSEQKVLKEGWNSLTSSGGVYSFQYSHPSLPSSVVHMKIIPMDHLLLVHSTSSSSSDPSSLFSLEINMNEYISEYMTENEGEYKWKALQIKFKNAIVYSLLPSLKPSSTPSTPPSRPPHGSGGDPLRISEPKQSFFTPFAPPSISPYNVGHNDVFPDFSGGFGGIGSGGMEVGPNHEIFRNYPTHPTGPLYYGPNDYDDDDDNINFHFNPLPNPNAPPHSPNHPSLPSPSPRFDPVGPLPSQNNKNNNKKDKRSPFGPDPDHLQMPGGDKDWYI